MFKLNGRTAVITGASGGIGGAIAKSLINAGAEVIISGTNDKALENLKTKLGDNCHLVVCDLSKSKGANSLFETAMKISDSIDILINNAGVTRDNLALRMKDEDWDSVINVNLSSAFRLTRMCIKGMMKKRWGRIINISSVVGFTGNIGQANYAASKAGMVGLSKALAQEVAPRGITVNCIAPGFIVTPMTDSLTEEIKGNLKKNIPLGRFGEVDDIASGVIYLSSNDAGYITGQTLHINGGLLMI